MRLTALRSTVGKKEPIDSSKLPQNQTFAVNQDWSIKIENVIEHRDNHVFLKLGYGAGEWWFFKPHIQLINTTKPKAKNTLAQRIVDCCIERNYPLDRETGHINIIGVEGMSIDGAFNADTPNQWNDSLFLIEFRNGQPEIVFKTSCTTEPGQYYTDNPLNKNGCARLDTGYHPNLWRVGLHRGYQALVQGNSVARLVRDRNRNHRRDDLVSHERGNGINLHTDKTTGWRGADNGTIGRWSAGCVVLNDAEEFKRLMRIITQGVQYSGNKSVLYSFTLLWSRWLEEIEKPVNSYPYNDRDIDIMTKTIWAEARGETTKGRVAVGWTIRNRAEKSPAYKWSSVIADVCLQPWQFSCWNANDPNLPKLKALNNSDPLYQECYEVARKVLSGELQDPTRNADHYYADYIAPPNWAKGQQPNVQIGTHIFFNLIG